ncbi:MAG: transglutaminase family protein [Planctomycetota bacterium]
MRYRINHTTKYAYTDPVAVCHNVVRLSPPTTEWQRVDSSRLIVLPEPADRAERVDAFGNRVGYFSIQQAHWGLSLSATSEVQVHARPEPGDGPAWETVRDAVRSGDARSAGEPDPLLLALPSALVPAATELRDYAAPSFAANRPIVAAVRDLTRRVFEDFEYDPTATTVSTPTLQAFTRRAGVCQDFAHVALGCVRSMGLAARYVSGYLRTIPPEGKPRLVGADASHAWLSVWCGDAAGWVDADPTNDTLAGTDHVTLALGRDYADACPIQGVYTGGGPQSLSVSVDVAPLDAEGAVVGR